MDGCENSLIPIMKFIGTVLKFIQIIVPIILIVMGSIDFVKATMGGKDDEIKKCQSTFIKRLIAAVLVFLIPLIVGVLLSVLNVTKSSCLTCVLNTSTCNMTITGGSGGEGTDSTLIEGTSNENCHTYNNEAQCKAKVGECEWVEKIDDKYNIELNEKFKTEDGSYCTNVDYKE